MNVLIVKIAAIGDVVMALSMVDAIYKKDSNAKITWLCGKAVEPLLRSLNSINELFVIDESKLLAGNHFEQMSVLLKVWKRLFGRRFDLIVTGNPDPRYRLLSLTTIGKERRSFTRNGTRLWPVKGRYHGSEYIRLITDIDGPDAEPGYLPRVTLPLREEIRSQLNLDSAPRIAIAPGGAKNVLNDSSLRRWPITSYVTLARRFIKDGIQVILTGAVSDEWVREKFSQLPVLDLIGNTTLVDLVGLYELCDLVITHDSSPLHLALLAGTPVVALFGPTNPREFVPRTDLVTILWGGEHLACRPCYDGKTYADCNNNVCMQSISVDMVYKAVKELLLNKKERKYSSSSIMDGHSHKKN